MEPALEEISVLVHVSTHEIQRHPAKNHRAAELGCGTLWVWPTKRAQEGKSCFVSEHH